MPDRADAVAPSILVVTIVHDPEDSRIRHRQIPALLADGWKVTYAAPFTAYGRSRGHVEGLTTVDLPRALGRDRLTANRAARRLLAGRAADHDLVLVHDPELLLDAVGTRTPNLVWDVHEDPAAALGVKTWLPGPARGVVAGGWRLAERLAERRRPLLLAEYSYQDRFRREHPVVPNTVTVPATVVAPGTARVVYLGTVTMARGCDVMVDVARGLLERTSGQCRLEIIGPARDDASRDLLTTAAEDGVLAWHGFVASGAALDMLPGALAGLSLLHDLPNYRHSRPTKIIEYMAHGVPVVTTPLPAALDLVEASRAGVVVPFGDAESTLAAVLALRDHPDRAADLGRRGHEAAVASYDWSTASGHFTGTLRGLLPPA